MQPLACKKNYIIDDLDAFKRALYNKFLQKLPDKPPVKGLQ